MQKTTNFYKFKQTSLALWVACLVMYWEKVMVSKISLMPS